MPSPRVSVVIPTYKSAPTLERAVRSVMAQTWANWELIIIDDGSMDETPVLANRLAAEDSRIRVLAQTTNYGKPHVMNVATAAALGDWIAVLDADDWYAPERLARLLQAAEGSNIAMVADNQMLYDAGANCAVGHALPAVTKPQPLALNDFLAHTDVTANFDYGMLKPMFQTTFLRQHNISYYEPARIGEDYLILLRFFAAGGRGVLVPEALYYYLQPFGTLSRQPAQPGRKDYNFTLLAQINAAGLAQVRDYLTPAQLAVLARRGQDIGALEQWQQLRHALRTRHPGRIFGVLIKAPLPFWRLAGKRLMQRLLRIFCPT